MFHPRGLDIPKAGVPPALLDAIQRTFRESDARGASMLAMLKKRILGLEGKGHTVIREYTAKVMGLKMDPSTGAEAGIIGSHPGPVCAIALALDMSWAVTGDESTIKRWDLRITN